MEQIIIVGAGPAGISAALYVKRGNLDPLVIDNGIGALEKAEKIENYYGLPEPVTGKQLYENGLAQAKALGIRILEAQVLGIEGFDTFEIKTTAGDYEAVSVILATGSRRKAPAIPGLKEYEGKGVSYCAICDAFFYRGKEVAILGHGDYALHEAEILSHTASKVTILTDGREPEFSGEAGFEVVTQKIAAIEGDGVVGSIKLEDGTQISAAGVFVAFGSAGSSDIARQMGAELTDKGHIKVNEDMESTIPGLYAAGDCTGGLLQVAKAVHEGAVAGLAASKYARSHA